MIRSFSFLLANSTATFAAATGSRENAIAVGPVNNGDSRSNFVPAKARRASRFFVTLKLAPAARICRLRSVTSSTVMPVWWVTTTQATSDSDCCSELTSFSFCDRSTLRLRPQDPQRGSVARGHPRDARVRLSQKSHPSGHHAHWVTNPRLMPAPQGALDRSRYLQSRTGPGRSHRSQGSFGIHPYAHAPLPGGGRFLAPALSRRYSTTPI